MKDSKTYGHTDHLFEILKKNIFLTKTNYFQIYFNIAE